MIKKHITEMAYPSNFSLKEFQSIPTYNGRIKYCDERLTKLGQGSSRIAYQVDNEKVLKIAKNKKGMEQNMQEADWGRNNYIPFAKIYEADMNNYTWVEMELASKIKKSEFKNLIGISFEQLCDVITFIKNSYSNGHTGYYNTSYSETKDFMKNEVYTEKNSYILDLYYYMTNYEPTEIGDLLKISSWGKVNRDGKEIPVIVDAGLMYL